MYRLNDDGVKQCLNSEEISACTHFYLREQDAFDKKSSVLKCQSCSANYVLSVGSNGEAVCIQSCAMLSATPFNETSGTHKNMCVAKCESGYYEASTIRAQ